MIPKDPQWEQNERRLAEMFPDYPCVSCGRSDYCTYHQRCSKYRAWLSPVWRTVTERLRREK